MQAAYKALTADPGKPLLPPGLPQRYFPGSTFKIVTASAVFDHGPTLATKTYPDLSALPLPQTNDQVLHNFGGEVCGGQLPSCSRSPATPASARSASTSAAPALTAEAEAFGFNKIAPARPARRGAQSYFPPGDSFEHDPAGLAYSAIGQENVQATPLEMALVAAAIANGGVIMTPHVLKEVTNSQSQVVSTYQPTPWLHGNLAGRPRPR